MHPESKTKPRLPPHVHRWGFIIAGAGFCSVAGEAALKGRILANVRGTTEGAISATGEPFRFWFLVCWIAAFGLALVTVGILKGGKDA